jgi:hypothetical protein
MGGLHGIVPADALASRSGFDGGKLSFGIGSLQSHAVVDKSAVEDGNIYELRDPPRRRLWRGPRYGSVLEERFWPWEG